MRWFERLLGVAALLCLIAAWVAGGHRQNLDLEPIVLEAMPGAATVELREDGVYEGRGPEGALVGYVALAEAQGYGGPLRLAVGVDEVGKIAGIKVVEHRETPQFYARAQREHFVHEMLGKRHHDDFVPGRDLDAVSGASHTTGALSRAARGGQRRVAGTVLGLEVPADEPPSIRIGALELIIAGLFAISLAGYWRRFRHRKALRWFCLLTGLLALGFAFDVPVTLANLTAFALGYWPDWRTHLYWYLLVAGVLFIPLLTGKNPYCEKICPFGAAQDCIGAMSTGKRRMPAKARRGLRWLQKTVTWGFLMWALYTRNPSEATFELYGTIFALAGSSLQFILLAGMLILSLVFARPWCAYLCPVPVVTEELKSVRGLVRKVGRRSARVRTTRARN